MTQQEAIAHLEELMHHVARQAGASCAAVFVPSGTGLAIAGRWLIDQAALDLVLGGWARWRGDLRAGKVVRYGHAVLWPLFDRGRQVCAVVYLDNAPEGFPGDSGKINGALLASVVGRIEVPTPKASYLACGLTHAEVAAEIEGDQLAVLLRLFNGNVTAVAHHLGITRPTVYDRAERFGLSIDAFRARRRRRRARRR